MTKPKRAKSTISGFHRAPPVRRSVGPPVRLLVALIFAFPTFARAQDSVIVIDPDARADTLDHGLAPGLLQRLVATFNDSLTTRFWGDADLPAGARLNGNTGVFHGSVRIAGTIDGNLLVINGSVAVLSGGTVTGDLVVVGGNLTVDEGGTVNGQREEYWDAAPVGRSADGTLVIRGPRRLPDFTTAQKSFRSGRLRTTVILGTEGTYNRVEGLPIVFGPTFEMALSRNTVARLDLHGTLRTARDADQLRDDLGYFARAELRLGGTHGLGIGIRAYNAVASIEDRPLGRSEVGWSAFLFQRDQHDYFGQVGFGGFLSGWPTPHLRVELGLRRDEESSLRANDPWSLFRNTDRWRPNPLVDDGHYVSGTLATEWDTRNSSDFPTSGWWLRSTLEHSSSDDVAPVSLPATVRDNIPTEGYAFNRVTLDLRRYNRLNANVRINLRFFASGHAGGDPLPIQRRVSLGGADLMPGYAFRAFTCTPAGIPDRAQAALCDRVMVAQAEFRTRLDLGLAYRYHDRLNGNRFIGIDQVDFVVLTDAGKSWLSGDGPGQVPADRIPALKEWKADIGIGLDAGNFGIYVARALTGGEPVRLSLRIKRRF